MASVNDIDTKQAVAKFLRRSLITPKTDDEANTADEIGALLETAALSFLLFPQAVLPIVLKAKNSLRQIVQADIDTVDFIVKAIGDVRNPDTQVSDTSDLVEAQTALVELDRLGRVSSDLPAFGRYKSAVNRFLDTQLAPSLKRNQKREFERTGQEARQDIFAILPQFGATHRVMIDRLSDLFGSVSDFKSVDLRRIVSVKTLGRVRASLRRVRSRIGSGAVSKTVAAIELLAGSAALESLSQDTDVFDPTVKSEEIPARRTIYLRTPDTQASVDSSSGPWSLSGSGWTFEGTVDPLSASPKAFSFEIPGPGASGAAYVSSELTAPVDIPTDGTLYIHLEGGGTPDREIAVTSGSSIALSTIISDIDAGLGADGTCIQNPEVDGLIIYGAGGVTSITIRPDSAAPGGTYNTDPSVHSLLGFIDFETSEEIGDFTPESLHAALRNQIPGASVELKDDKIVITSNNTDPRQSSIDFSSVSGEQGEFGFSGDHEAEPGYLELVEDGEVVDASSLGIFVGSTVTGSEDSISGSALRTLNNEPIIAIDGGQLSFGISLLPRGSEISTTVYAPVVVAVQKLLQELADAPSFEDDFAGLQRALSPILSRPTTAQINDALRLLDDIRVRLVDLQSILDGVTVRPDRSSFFETAQKILFSLEERGLDRARELISTGRFSQFFSLSQEKASKASRFMKSMEDVVTTDIPLSTIEQDIDDGVRPSGDNPQDTVLDDLDPDDIDDELISVE